MKFILADKDFESIIADVPESKISIELRKLDKKFYSIFYHYGDEVQECGTFTKEELWVIWKMLSGK